MSDMDITCDLRTLLEAAVVEGEATIGTGKDVVLEGMWAAAAVEKYARVGNTLSS